MKQYRSMTVTLDRLEALDAWMNAFAEEGYRICQYLEVAGRLVVTLELKDACLK